MYPYIFPDSLHLSSYTLFFLLAVLVTVGGSRYMIKNHTHYNQQKIVLLLVFCLIAGIVGARVLHVLTRRSSYMAHPDLIFSLSLHGFSGYGALICMLLVGCLLSLLWKLHPFKLADLVAPSVGAGIVLMRVGCFLHGCCFGKETNLPRGIMPHAGSEAASFQVLQHIGTGNMFGPHELHPIHPTQLYDALLAGSGAFLSYLLWKKGAPAGVGGLFFLIWYTLGRYFLAPFREPSRSYDAHATFFPRMYLIVLFVAISMVIGHMVYQKVHHARK